MKIGIISHSPLWTTGFGVTCNRIAHSLIRSGHAVYCFSLGEGSESKEYPFMIYHSDWLEAVNKLSLFLEELTPDIILINFDINAVTYFIKFCKLLKWRKKIFAHIVMDGFPVYDHILQTIQELDGIIVPTRASQRYLKSEGIKKVRYAPHGVNRSEFIPLNKDGIRLKLGFKKKINRDFIIGLFAKNEERKQIQKVFLALRYLVHDLKQKNIWLYVHSQTKPEVSKGWDLEYLARHLNLTNHIIFTGKDFKQDEGVETLINNNNQLSYVERINMCDVIVNVPFSGGFELCNVEAQSCGIPVITVNDESNIKEVVGDSALLLDPAMKTIWGNGAWICIIDEVELANKILEIKNNQDLRETLRQKGFENIKRFPWSRLEKTINKMIGHV